MLEKLGNFLFYEFCGSGDLKFCITYSNAHCNGNIFCHLFVLQ